MTSQQSDLRRSTFEELVWGGSGDIVDDAEQESVSLVDWERYSTGTRYRRVQADEVRIRSQGRQIQQNQYYDYDVNEEQALPVVRSLNGVNVQVQESSLIPIAEEEQEGNNLESPEYPGVDSGPPRMTELHFPPIDPSALEDEEEQSDAEGKKPEAVKDQNALQQTATEKLNMPDSLPERKPGFDKQKSFLLSLLAKLQIEQLELKQQIGRLEEQQLKGQAQSDGATIESNVLAENMEGLLKHVQSQGEIVKKLKDTIQIVCQEGRTDVQPLANIQQTLTTFEQTLSDIQNCLSKEDKRPSQNEISDLSTQCLNINVQLQAIVQSLNSEKEYPYVPVSNLVGNAVKRVQIIETLEQQLVTQSNVVNLREWAINGMRGLLSAQDTSFVTLKQILDYQLKSNQFDLIPQNFAKIINALQSQAEEVRKYLTEASRRESSLAEIIEQQTVLIGRAKENMLINESLQEKQTTISAQGNLTPENLQREMGNFDEQIQSLKEKLDEKVRKVSEGSNIANDLLEKITRQSNYIISLNERLSQLKPEDTLKQQETELMGDVELEAKAIIKTLEAQLRDYKDKLAELQLRQSLQNKVIETNRQSLEKLEGKLQDNKLDQTERHDTIKQLQLLVDDQDKFINYLQRDKDPQDIINALENTLKTYIDKKESDLTERESLQDEAGQLKQQVISLEDQVKSYRGKLKEAAQKETSIREALERVGGLNLAKLLEDQNQKFSSIIAQQVTGRDQLKNEFQTAIESLGDILKQHIARQQPQYAPNYDQISSETQPSLSKPNQATTSALHLIETTLYDMVQKQQEQINKLRGQVESQQSKRKEMKYVDDDKNQLNATIRQEDLQQNRLQKLQENSNAVLQDISSLKKLLEHYNYKLDLIEQTQQEILANSIPQIAQTSQTRMYRSPQSYDDDGSQSQPTTYDQNKSIIDQINEIKRLNIKAQQAINALYDALDDFTANPVLDLQRESFDHKSLRDLQEHLIMRRLQLQKDEEEIAQLSQSNEKNNYSYTNSMSKINQRHQHRLNQNHRQIDQNERQPIQGTLSHPHTPSHQTQILPNSHLFQPALCVCPSICYCSLQNSIRVFLSSKFQHIQSPDKLNICDRLNYTGNSRSQVLNSITSPLKTRQLSVLPILDFEGKDVWNNWSDRSQTSMNQKITFSSPKIGHDQFLTACYPQTSEIEPTNISVSQSAQERRPQHQLNHKARKQLNKSLSFAHLLSQPTRLGSLNQQTMTQNVFDQPNRPFNSTYDYNYDQKDFSGSISMGSRPQTLEQKYSFQKQPFNQSLNWKNIDGSQHFGKNGLMYDNKGLHHSRNSSLDYGRSIGLPKQRYTRNDSNLHIR